MCQRTGERVGYRIRKMIHNGGFQEEHRATSVLQKGNFKSLQGPFSNDTKYK